MVDWNGRDGRRNTSLTEKNKDEGGTFRDDISRQSTDDKVYSLAHSVREEKKKLV